ncbi:MFS transporter [Tersicoccus sp. MR15.9]|uniref:MFS transporter n=1 Tax=Tersicoccus mangrovi TaxID=3121635 RepID=UPI002FE5AC21
MARVRRGSHSPDPVPLWRNADYRWWLAADTSPALGRSLLTLAVPLLALAVTGSPAQAGVVTAVGAVGRVLAVLPGGVLTDRHDRRVLILAGAGVGVVVAATLAVLLACGLLDFWLLTLLNLVLAVRSGLVDATPNAALPSVVDSSRLGSAVAANQGRDAVVSLTGGPIGGVLMAVGHAVPFVATAILYAGTAVAVLRIRADLRPGAGAPGTADAASVRDEASAERVHGTDERPAHPGWLAEAWAGFAWLAGRPELRGVMAVSTIVNLGIGAAMTAVVFGLQQRGESPATIGLTSASVGAGLLVGSLVAPFLVQRVPTGVLAGTGLVALAGALAVLPFVHAVPAVCAALAAGMAAAPAINAGLLGYFMVAVPSRLLGRASSALDLLALGAVPLAPLLAGFGYTAWGWSGVLTLCAGIGGIAAVLALASRGLRSLPSAPRWSEHAAGAAAG